jgi:hypothetical protein
VVSLQGHEPKGGACYQALVAEVLLGSATCMPVLADPGDQARIN